MRAKPAAQPQRTTRSEVVRASCASRCMNFRLAAGTGPAAQSKTDDRMGFEPEVLAQAALWTIAGGARSPAVATAGRTVIGGRSLSEGRAGKQRDQCESSDERFHDASLHVYGRRPWVPATAAGRRPLLADLREIGPSISSDELYFWIYRLTQRWKPSYFGLVLSRKVDALIPDGDCFRLIRNLVR